MATMTIATFRIGHWRQEPHQKLHIAPDSIRDP
jgi:hypothetical protein